MNLSIVTVCLNAEKYIDKTILSVLNQTIPVYEYLVIDGKSTDNTIKVVNEYKERFKSKGVKFKVISERDNGISDAFNKGITLATGDYIGLLNADDELMETTHEVLQMVHNSTLADIYYGNSLWIENQNDLAYIMRPKATDERNLKKLLFEMVMVHPATYVSKVAYEKVGVFDITFKYCMDQELLYRMYINGVSFKYIDHVMTKFKAGGISDTNAKLVLNEAERIPLMYGENRLKCTFNKNKKLARNNVVRFLKKIGVYKILRGVER